MATEGTEDSEIGVILSVTSLLVPEKQNRRVIGSVPAHRRKDIATENSEINVILTPRRRDIWK